MVPVLIGAAALADQAHGNCLPGLGSADLFCLGGDDWIYLCRQPSTRHASHHVDAAGYIHPLFYWRDSIFRTEGSAADPLSEMRRAMPYGLCVLPEMRD